MNKDKQGFFGTTRDFAEALRGWGKGKAPATLLSRVLGRVGLGDGYFRVETPIGQVFVAFNEKGVSAVLRGRDAAAFERSFRERFGRPVYPLAKPPRGLVRDITAHLAGMKRKRMKMNLAGLSEFERAVLRKTLEIPRGEVRPYAWIAREIGHPKAVRAVGTALAKNPIPLLIPCHRVVRTDGKIGNYALGSEAKHAILATEGVDLENLRGMVDAGLRFYGSDTTHIFCYPTCRHAQRISEAHRVSFKSEEDALKSGYRPCKTCRPLAAA